MQLENGHLQAIFWPYLAILVENIVFSKIDFYVQKDFKNAMGNNVNNGSEGREKISQKWPDFHHFWNCGHIIPKHKMKIYMDHFSVLIVQLGPSFKSKSKVWTKAEL